MPPVVRVSPAEKQKDRRLDGPNSFSTRSGDESSRPGHEWKPDCPDRGQSLHSMKYPQGSKTTISEAKQHPSRATDREDETRAPQPYLSIEMGFILYMNACPCNTRLLLNTVSYLQSSTLPFYFSYYSLLEHKVVDLVETLRYTPEGRGFDFSLT